MINDLRLLTAVALLLSACAAPMALVLPQSGDPVLHATAIALRARSAEVVYLGEVHDNPHHHAHQRRVLEAMLGAGARPVVAFEMLAADRQATVDRALEAAGGAADLDAALGWSKTGWPDFGMYWPLFDLARRSALRVVAADLDVAVARRIAREGLSAVPDGARLRSLLPPDPAREAVIARTIRTGHCDLLPERHIPTMVESWHARNVSMARRLAEALAQTPQVVVIAGRGHQAPGGLPAQLEALRPGTRQLVVEMLEVGPDDDPREVLGEATGDIVWLTPPATRPDPCEALRRRLRQ
ncbi:MAG: ChaN family lipoprotein [Candidatus Rokubacteria bacterium]|nr:ChaN family lipoprotein [Candidatus Rokubacteria bacterium]